MTVYKTEVEVEKKIEDRLKTAGCKSRVSVHSDKQEGNTVERTVLFKVVVALDGSEVIINAMADIGENTDRAITYKGSQVEPGNGGEIRILFFEANINPY